MRARIILTLLFISFSVSAAFCQESMLSNISYTYLEKLIAVAKKNYPEIEVRNNQVLLAKNNIDKSQVSYLDALNLAYYYRPNSSVDIVNPNLFNGFQLGVNVNLGTLIAKPYATKDAQILYKTAVAQQREYNQNIEVEVKRRYFAYVDQQSQLKLRTKSYADAQNLVTQLQHKFEKGESTFDDYSRALLLSTQENQMLIEAQSGTLVAKASLEELLGVKLEDVK